MPQRGRSQHMRRTHDGQEKYSGSRKTGRHRLCSRSRSGWREERHRGSRSRSAWREKGYRWSESGAARSPTRNNSFFEADVSGWREERHRYSRSRSGWREKGYRWSESSAARSPTRNNSYIEADVPWREQPSKKTYQNETQAEWVESEELVEEIITVPQSQLGRIVGRKGAQVRELEIASSTRIDVNLYSTDHDTAERDIRIKGKSDCVAKAKSLISDLIQLTVYDRSDRSEETFNIPKDSIARIIGKGGENVKRLQVESGAKIDVDGNSGVVTIRGNTDSVANAVKLIWSAVDESKEKTNPAADDTNPVAGDGEPCIEETIDVPKLMVARIIGKGGQKLRSLQGDSGARIEADGNTGKVCVRGDADSVTRAIDLISELMDEIADKDPLVADDDAVEEIVEVSRAVAGRVIGRGGENRKRLELDYGVQIYTRGEGRGFKIRGRSDAVNDVMDKIRQLKEEAAAKEEAASQNAPANSTSLAPPPPPPAILPRAISLETFIEETIPVPSHAMGHVCGIKGTTLMKVQSGSGAKVDKVSSNAVHLAGSSECVERARNMIMALIAERSQTSGGIEDGVVEETVEVPPGEMGRICGRGGATIMKVQVDSGAKVNIDKTKGNAVQLRGSSESVLNARNMIMALLAEQEDVSAKKQESSPAVVETMDVSEHVLGAIFGHGGSTIKKLEKESGARIKVEQVNLQWTVTFSGTSDSVANARETIIELVESEANPVVETIEIPEADHLKALLGVRGQNAMSIQKESGAKISADKVNFKSVTLSGSEDCVSRARVMIDEFLAKKRDKITETITIPANRIGRIFGHGGEHVMKLQDVSGAKLTIDKAEFKSLDVSGPRQCVKLATDLITELFAEPAVEGNEISPFWMMIDERLKDIMQTTEKKVFHSQASTNKIQKPVVQEIESHVSSTDSRPKKIFRPSSLGKSVPAKPSQAPVKPSVRPSQAPTLASFERVNI